MFLAIMAGSLICGTGFAEEKDLVPQTVCPVMGGKIDKEIFADYKGRRVYFCCEGCRPNFTNDPEK